MLDRSTFSTWGGVVLREIIWQLKLHSYGHPVQPSLKTTYNTGQAWPNCDAMNSGRTQVLPKRLDAGMLDSSMDCVI
eukprot:5160539-Amphidinium_carterae.1